MDKPHSLVVAGPGLGLVNGSMALSKSLASAGFAVTLVCFARFYHTHANTKRLQSLDPAVRLEIVPDGLDLADAQNYMDLFLITDTMQQGLEKLVEKLGDERHPVTCIISDTFMAWTQDLANKFGIPRIDFFTTNATTYLLILAIPELIARGYLAAQKDDCDSPLFIDCVKGRPRFPLDELDRKMLVDDPHNHVLHGLVKSAALAKEAERVLIHSVSVLESSAFESLYKEYGIKACAIGPLMHEYPAEQYQGPPATCLSWLDGQGSSSVVYVSFGSNAALSRDEFVELAHGLEASGQAFLWVVRSDATAAGEQLCDILPEGFLTRTQNRGLIVPWAPQLAVLAHPAVGGFLTHCGWNSTLESLWNGVPMLGCPRGAEQKTNARFIAEAWRAGIELARTDTGGFHRKEVEKGVKALMIDEQARTRVQALKEIVRKAASKGGASHSNLVEFANDMRTLLH